MLVLSRKSTERITIGNNISIEVRRIAGNRVTLAIDAPRDIRILRGELEGAATAFEQSDDSSQDDAEKPLPAVAPGTLADATDSNPTEYRVAHHRGPLSDVLTDALGKSAPQPVNAAG
ncbi:MAG: carbon storage regulator [Planctomycetota bacterium]